MQNSTQKPLVLILGVPADEHAQHVYQALSERGARVYYLNSQEFPNSVGLSYEPLENAVQLRLGNESLVPEQIRSVYWRNFGPIHARVDAQLPHAEQAHIAQNDARSLLESVLFQAPIRWVNGIEGFQMHQRKPSALARVARLGVRIPRTLYTNVPKDAEAFVETVGECIFKPVQGGAYTRLISRKDLNTERLERLRLAPVTLQERIVGKNIRVFVAGEEVRALEIETEQLDFREDRAVRITPISMGKEFEDQCRTIAQALHLKWTGMDFIRNKKGEAYFLEANPSPMFMGFEKMAKVPLMEMLCRLLLSE